jgi:hypothetical protein
MRILEMNFRYHVILLTSVLRFIYLVQSLRTSTKQQHKDTTMAELPSNLTSIQRTLQITGEPKTLPILTLEETTQAWLSTDQNSTRLVDKTFLASGDLTMTDSIGLDGSGFSRH